MDGQQKFWLHLKHMMFCDAYSMIVDNGCNHNAMDRCSMGEGATLDTLELNFDEIYEKYQKRYAKLKLKWDVARHGSESNDGQDIEQYAIECADMWIERLYQLRNDETWVAKEREDKVKRLADIAEMKALFPETESCSATEPESEPI